MRTQVGVIEESELDAPFEFRFGEWGKERKAEKSLCRFPGSFDKADGADFAQGYESTRRHGADVRYVQELLGHPRLKTIALYPRVSPKKLPEVPDRSHLRERSMLKSTKGKAL